MLQGGSVVIATERSAEDLTAGTRGRRVLLGYRNGKRVRPSFYGDTRQSVRRDIEKAVRDWDRGLVIGGGRSERRAVSQRVDADAVIRTIPETRKPAWSSSRPTASPRMSPACPQSRRESSASCARSSACQSVSGVKYRFGRGAIYG